MFTGLSLFDEAVKVGQSYGGRVLIKKELNDVENVEFDYKQNIFSVSFASDNYNLPEKTQYMYKLEGFNRSTQCDFYESCPRKVCFESEGDQ